MQIPALKSERPSGYDQQTRGFRDNDSCLYFSFISSRYTNILKDIKETKEILLILKRLWHRFDRIKRM
jgi:hypothetical protein